MKIGQVAAQSGVSVQAVRFYEKLGLIGRPSRAENGYRIYDEETIVRLRFLRKSQALGFSLEEIGQLLALRMKYPGQCNSVRVNVERKLVQTRAKLRDLKRLEQTLLKIRTACENNQLSENCPILRMLEEKK